MVGYMPMPANFQYADVLRRGQPRHGLRQDTLGSLDLCR